MRQQTYLNVILTVNAALLAGVIWTQVADRPLLVESAHAQPKRGFPNPSQQRQTIISLLKSIDSTTAEQAKLLESGKLKVEITALPEPSEGQSADAKDGELPPGVVLGGSNSEKERD